MCLGFPRSASLAMGKPATRAHSQTTHPRMTVSTAAEHDVSLTQSEVVRSDWVGETWEVGCAARGRQTTYWNRMVGTGDVPQSADGGTTRACEQAAPLKACP